MLIPLTIVVLPDSLMTQYLCVLFTGSATIVLVSHKWPFETPTMNRSQIVEEVFIMVLMYHILCFSDWMPDPVVASYLGYSFISVIVFILLALHGFSIILKLRQKCRAVSRARLIKRAHKHALRISRSDKPFEQASMNRRFAGQKAKIEKKRLKKLKL